MNRYPDERVDVLTRALEKCYGDYHFVTGVGMDGVIETLMRTLVEPGETVAISTPTFSFYGLAAQAQGAKVIIVPRKNDFSVDAEALAQAGRNAKITVLCTPNNPTGNATSLETVARVLEGAGGIVFLDNAYVEFSDTDYLPLLRKYDNLVIGRTFSKVHSLAGLRIGYAFVPAWLVPSYQRAGTPFTVNSVSAAAAAAALEDTEHAADYIKQVLRWRARFTAEVKFPVLPSDANFVMVDVLPIQATKWWRSLQRKGCLSAPAEALAGFPIIISV